MAALIDETVDLLNEEIFAQMARDLHGREAVVGGEDIIPNKLPIKRRLADYRYLRGKTSASSSSSVNLQHPINFSQFTTNLWAIEKFRDITPVMVIAVFDSWIVLQPGDIGPLPLHHPIAQQIIKDVNERHLSRCLLQKIREVDGPLYDGCAVVGIVDYRNWAISKLPSNREKSPEMHKVLLKPHIQTLISLTENNDFEVEAKLLKAVSGSLCLDPSPIVSEITAAFDYFDRKMNPYIEKIVQKCIMDCANKAIQQEDYENSYYYSPNMLETFKRDNINIFENHGPASQMQRFRLLTTIEQQRMSRERSGSDPMYGLDARKDPARLNLTSSPPLSWLQPGMSLWRTLRFEDRPLSEDTKTTTLGTTTHYTVHIIINQHPLKGIRFESLIRIGGAPCLGDLHDYSVYPYIHAILPSRIMVESYLDQLRKTMQIEGKICVADVSNPNALAALVRQNETMLVNIANSDGVPRRFSQNTNVVVAKRSK